MAENSIRADPERNLSCSPVESLYLTCSVRV